MTDISAIGLKELRSFLDFFFTLVFSLLLKPRLSKKQFSPCKVSYRFFKAVVYFFVHCSTLSFSTSDYISKTRFGPCKVIYRFFKAVVYFFLFIALLFPFQPQTI